MTILLYAALFFGALLILLAALFAVLWACGMLSFEFGEEASAQTEDDDSVRAALEAQRVNDGIVWSGVRSP